MKINILTLFPDMFKSFFEHSILKRGLSKDVFSYQLINFRDHSENKHKRVDYPPIGGGAGLVLAFDPIYKALKSVKSKDSTTVILSPRGVTYNQDIAKKLSQVSELNIICGHYEGFDERIYQLGDITISMGDYILTGGEIGAMALVDSVTRLLDGTISKDSLDEESFDNGLLEYPQYVEPFKIDEEEVPLILYSGNHEAIRKWRKKQSLLLTRELRPDLFKKYKLNKEDIKLLSEEEPAKWEIEAIKKGSKFTKK